jgi:hypothetical protein
MIKKREAKLAIAELVTTKFYRYSQKDYATIYGAEG